MTFHRFTGRARALLAAAATALIVVTAAGAAPGDPVAVDDFVTTTVGTPVTFNPLANDSAGGGTLRIDRIDDFTGADPLLLALSIDGFTGETTVEPRAPHTGVFTFRYVAADEDGDVGKARVHVSVRATNVPTVAGLGSYDAESGNRTAFELEAAPLPGGAGVTGAVFFERFRPTHDAFLGTVTTLSGTGPNATLGGTGVLNGLPGYTFTVQLVEKGEPGAHKGDRIGVVIRGPGGAVVYSTGGTTPISTGNVKVL